MGRFLALAMVLFVLATTTSGQKKLLWRLHEMLPADPVLTMDIAQADVDLDGDLDLLCGNLKHPGSLYLNDGTGVFTNASDQLPQLYENTRGVALGDLDADGDPDAVFANEQGDRAYSNSGGVFTEIPAAFSPGFLGCYSSSSVALGDVDADGDLDALFGSVDSFCSAKDHLFLNDGMGVFSDTTSQIPYSTNTNDLALVDVDADGDLDALIGKTGPDKLWRNDGSGIFLDDPVALNPNPGEHTVSWSIGDVDGDSDLDALAGTGVSAFQNRLRLNDGTGGFAFSATFPAHFDNTKDVLLFDADGDSDLDASIANDYTQNLYYENVGSGVFVDATSDLPTLDDRTEAASSGDFDGDGDVDLVFGGRDPNRLLLNDGSGVWFDALPSTFIELGAGLTALADFDGDDDLDAFFFEAPDYPFALLLNQGYGLFTDATSLLPGPPLIRTVAEAEDVDADGDIDLFLGSNLWVNDGSASFSDVTATQLPVSPGAFSADFGDVDGDGDPDLFLGLAYTAACFSTPVNRLWVNDGAGSFSDASSQIPQVKDDSYAVEFGDVDADGDLDILIGNANCSGEQNRLHLNNGVGLFSDVTDAFMPPDEDWTWDVAMGDVDLDGDLDAVIANLWAPNQLLLNLGHGMLIDASSTLLPAQPSDPTSDVVLEDLDIDGDLDLLFGSSVAVGFKTVDRLYLNDGSGTYVDASSEIAPFGSTNLATGDLDGDGDIDVWVGILGNPILWNLTRHVAWRNVASIGKTLVMDVYGPPSEGWVLAASTAPADIPFPPHGTIFIDPSSLLLISSGLLGGDGRASPSYATPLDPALLGVTVYWQAIVGWEMKLTNADATTITSL